MALSSDEEEEEKEVQSLPKRPKLPRKGNVSTKFTSKKAKSLLEDEFAADSDLSVDGDEDMGKVELRPPEVTCWKEKVSIFLLYFEALNAVAGQPTSDKHAAAYDARSPQVVPTLGHTFSHLADCLSWLPS